MADDNSNPEISLEKQEENRKPGTWLPGQSGNPLGRPKKGHSITETIKAMMDEKPEIKRALAVKILQMAAEGDITAIKTVWNYLDGMPLQKNEIGGSNGEPIKLAVLAGLGFIPPDTKIDATSSGGNAELSTTVQSDSVAQTGKEDDNSDL